MDVEDPPDRAERRCDRAAELLADGEADAAHLRQCPDCADTVRRLRADPAVGPDLELRLLQEFRDWRSEA